MSTFTVMFRYRLI